MSFKKKVVRIAVCIRCGHNWLPRAGNKRPAKCPSCFDPLWDRPRIYKKHKKAKGPQGGSK